MDTRAQLIACRLDRRHLLATAIAAVSGVSLIGRTVAQQAPPDSSPVAATPADWYLPGGNPAGTRAAVTSIDTNNVATLASAWATDIGGTVAGTPVEAGGSVFVVTWDGLVVALDLARGEQIWTYSMGASVADPMFGGTVGAVDGAAVVDGVVFAGDAVGRIHAIDAANGTVRWTVAADAQRGAAILAAPTVFGSTVYAPVATLSDDATFRGSLVALAADDGALQWQRFFALDSGQGGAAASTPAIDTDTSRVFLSVGVSNSAPPSVFALDAATGDVLWQTAIDLPANGVTELPAPTAAVNCFNVAIDGQDRAVLGAGFPDGGYRLFDRSDGGLIWERAVSRGGPFGGILGASATDGGKVVTPATNWGTVDAPANGAVMAVDAASGNFGWMSITANPSIASLSIANGVLFYGGLDGIVRADALGDGSHLWSEQLDASIGSGIAVLDRTIIFGTGSPAVGSFVKPGTQVVAYALASDGTPVPSAAGEPEASPTAMMTETPTPAGAVFEATMQGLKFIPAEIDIAPGTTVIWKNDDVVAHTVTQRAKPEDQLFASAYISPGESYSFTFDTAGTYAYFCLPHPFMTGTVVVS